MSGVRQGIAPMRLEPGPEFDRRVEREIFGFAGEPRRFYSVEDSAAQLVIQRVQDLIPEARVQCAVENGMFRCDWWLGSCRLGSAIASQAALSACAASLEARRNGAALASGQFRRRAAPGWLPAAGLPASAGPTV